MDLQALQQTLRQFADERDWQPFHTPKNLAMALMVEAAELAEIFQWMTPEQSQAAAGDVVVQQQIGDEVADVLLYLLQLADHTAIDLKRAVGRKLQKNARKYPPVRPGRPSAGHAAVPSETHVLIDWENVQPGETDLRDLVPDATDVWVFHGPAQRRVAERYASFGERATPVQIARTGKNALDFHLSFYMGYIASRHPDARFVVVSNDKGYGPMLEHAGELGFAARQVGFTREGKSTRGRTAARPARKTAAKAAPKPVAAPAPRRAAAAAPPPAPALAPALAPAPAKPPAAKKPAPRTRRAKARDEATPAEALPSAPATAPASAPLPMAASPAPAPAPAARPARRRGAKAGADVAAGVPLASPADTVPSADPAAGAAAPATRKSRARKTGSTAATPVAAPAAPAKGRGRKTATPASAAAPSAKALQHVVSSLKKNANKPARRARLVAAVRALLASQPGEAADDAAVEAALAHLVATHGVRIDDKGAVRYGW
ncbi:PIN domain-containing protein [Ideonella sp.]|uniref:PIN domain-containing protein n=1 Tax=Ideonella sp. TaxID=1929293 RepID=UPI0035AE235D